MTVRADGEAADERMADPDVRQLPGGDPHGIEEARSNDPFEQGEVGQMGRARRLLQS
jgi:hypothetical protein